MLVATPAAAVEAVSNDILERYRLLQQLEEAAPLPDALVLQVRCWFALTEPSDASTSWVARTASRPLHIVADYESCYSAAGSLAVAL
jgi:hypothetical protein